MNIYLSPHFDDACFSIGGIIQASQKGYLINIYTKSDHVENIFIAQQLKSHHKAISTLRKQEDMAFVNSCKLTAINLNFKEPKLLGINPFDLNNINNDVAFLNKHLIKVVLDIIQSRKSQIYQIFCPIGIGGHRNHVSTTLSILKNINFIREKAKVYFYEDLPYANNPSLRYQGLRRLLKMSNQKEFFNTKIHFTTEQYEEKRNLIKFYKSQHLNSPDINNFFLKNITHQTYFESLWEMEI